MSHWTQKTCKPCEGGVGRLSQEEITQGLSQLEGWVYKQGELQKNFSFNNYYQNIAFVNAVAWIAHRENHHPLLEVGFRSCLVRYSTHAIEGVSENDLICAAKVDAVFRS